MKIRLVTLADGEGFEPPVPCGTAVFKTAAIDHSATHPTVVFIGIAALAPYPLASLYIRSLLLLAKHGERVLETPVSHCNPLHDIEVSYNDRFY